MTIIAIIALRQLHLKKAATMEFFSSVAMPNSMKRLSVAARLVVIGFLLAEFCSGRAVAAPNKFLVVDGQWQALSASSGSSRVFLRPGDRMAYQVNDVKAPQAVYVHPVLRPVPTTSQVAAAAKTVASVPAGVFVYRNGWPQIDVDGVARGAGYVEPSGMNFDFTYNENGVTRLASDSSTFKIVALYEPDCVGCTVELGTLLQEATKLASNNVQVFLITSAPEGRVRAALQGLPYPNSITVVSDYRQSLYAAMHVKILPVQYIMKGSAVKFVHLGSLSAEELKIFLTESGKKI